MSDLVKVGITHGDINGISYEILLKIFSSGSLLEIFNPVIYGSLKASSYHKKIIGLNTINFNVISNVDMIKKGQLNFINCIKDDINIELGKPSVASGDSAYIALDNATKDLSESKIDVLVTLPINKNSIQNENFKFPGHTEFLQDRFPPQGKSIMMMIYRNFRIALVTSHIPVSQISKHINKKDIIERLKSLDYSLKRDFRIENPRIAVLGLNPHCGENGLLGNEELDIIIPAVKEASDMGILCSGPFASDGFFGSHKYNSFDAVLAMYHDQGLIPFKYLAMNYGVNYTAGLNIVRTSPDHGTAYDIAGKGIASPDSFREAIYLAIDIYRNRIFYDESRKNPLNKTYFEKGKDDEKLNF